MSEQKPYQKPYRIEVTIDAPRDVVWQALTDPAEIRRWFGWDTGSLDEEVRYIFVEHATATPPDLMDFGDGQTLTLVPDGERTIVRFVSAGSLDDTDWTDIYDEIEEGWRAFFNQLRHYLERHRGENRRTVYLSGAIVPAAAVAGVDAITPGEPWLASRHQRITAVDDYDGGLVAVLAKPGVESSEPGHVSVTVTTYGLDDAKYAEARERWASWWQSAAEKAKVTP